MVENSKMRNSKDIVMSIVLNILVPLHKLHNKMGVVDMKNTSIEHTHLFPFGNMPRLSIRKKN